MALTVLQNCQRITICMWFFTLLMVTILLTIRLIKKKIDVIAPQEEEQSDPAAQNYRESESQQHVAASSFEQAAVKANNFTEYDTCTERFMKKMGEINVLFNPLLITLPLNMVAGRTYAFSVVVYFVAWAFCLVFNVFKVHRTCVEFKVSRLFLESIWILLSLLLLLNLWVTDPSSMLYKLRA